MILICFNVWSIFFSMMETSITSTIFLTIAISRIHNWKYIKSKDLCHTLYHFNYSTVAARHLRVKHVSLKLSSVPHTVQCGYKWSVKPGMIKESERVLSKSSCIVFDEDGIFFKRNYTELVLSDDGIWYYSFFWTRGVFLMLTAPKCRCNCRWCS